jgi:hypothetical protein
MAAIPTIDTGDQFRLRNDHPDQPLVVKLGKRTYSIKPGQTAIVPFELIRVYWGDPRCRPGVYTKFSDSAGRGYVNQRELEIARLGNLYGSFAGDVAELNNPHFPPSHARANEQKHTPWPVSIQTEAGETVIPPCFDETGDLIYHAVQTETEDLNDPVTYRDHLEKRFDEMAAELRRLQGQDGSATDDAEVDIPVR